MSDDYDDFLDDDDDFDCFDDFEPIGSCERCGCNLYWYDEDDVCDQCSWSISDADGGA